MKAVTFKKGESVDFIPSVAVAAGDVVVFGDLIGISETGHRGIRSRRSCNIRRL
jgi:predicted RecA/RadA family phage recombinase